MSDQRAVALTYAALHRKSKGKRYLVSRNLIPALSEETGLAIADVKMCLGQLYKEGKICGSVSDKGEVYGRVKVCGEPPRRTLSECETTWLRALAECGLSDSKDDLIKCADSLEGLSLADMKTLIEGITRLKDDAPSLLSEDPRFVSARYLLGSSKALDMIGGVFGVPSSLFKGRAAYVVMAGPPQPECVLLIENQAPFEAFCDSGVAERAMGVATFGYGLSWSGISGAIGTRNIKQLIRMGAPPDFSEIVNKVPCYFWGDVDKEGLNIYLQLRSKIPKLKLSALNHPMLGMVRDKNSSHPYCKLADKVGQKNIASNDELVSKLRVLCSERAVDQEAVDKKDILLLYNKELEL